MQHGALRVLASSRLGDRFGPCQIAGKVVNEELLDCGHFQFAFERGAIDFKFGRDRFVSLDISAA